MNVPNHIAIILDGNGRWAKERGNAENLWTCKGNAPNLENICYDIKDLGVKYLTVLRFFHRKLETLQRRSGSTDETVPTVILRNVSRFPRKIYEDESHRRCYCLCTGYSEECPGTGGIIPKDFVRYLFSAGINYGSRDEIRRGMQKMAQDVKDGKVEPDNITEDTIESYLDTAGVPDPDLMIRTSGEQRLSNFLLWQLAYSEFYFTPVAWPDFNKEELIKAIEKYNQRDRRYGGVKEE